jgi:hypothetical protein
VNHAFDGPGHAELRGRGRDLFTDASAKRHVKRVCVVSFRRRRPAPREDFGRRDGRAHMGGRTGPTCSAAKLTRAWAIVKGHPDLHHTTGRHYVEGGLIGYRWILHDLTVRLHAEALAREMQCRLRDLAEHWRQLDGAKSHFLNLASHELRTPLTVLGGYLAHAGGRHLR